jgi:hypothetical protein
MQPKSLSPDPIDRPEEVDQHANEASFHGDTLQSITRLVIGGVEVSADELLRRLAIWESEVSDTLTSHEKDGTTAENRHAAVVPSSRLALIGLIFEMQDGLRTGAKTLGKIEKYISNLLDPFVQPMLGSRLLAPTRRSYDNLANRGKLEVERWITRGMREETHSRLLAEKGFDDIVDTYIEYLASNPEVQELVQSQSTGLANEVVEEVRERTVSADTFLEGLARSLLRRIPRSNLPPPPPEVRSHAASLRSTKKGPPSRQ